MISVCIASYNGEKFIESQVASILKQLGAADEVVVSDAGSTDGTLRVLHRLNDTRLKVVEFHDPHPPVGGSVFAKMIRICRNFEHALRHAQGDVIFLADQDDVWMDDKVEKVTAALERYVCVVHDCEVFDGEHVLQPSFLQFRKPSPGLLGTFWKSPFMGCCMAFRRTVLERALPIPDLPVEHDTYLGMIACLVGEVGILREPLIRYRRHGANASSCSEGSDNPWRVMFLRRWYLLKALVGCKKRH